MSETEYVPEQTWCPECQSPATSDYSHVLYCKDHRQPVIEGEADRLISLSPYFLAGDAGGESNKAVCDFFHRHAE